MERRDFSGWFIAAYAAAVLTLLPSLSLWLDEILTLIGAQKPDVRSMLLHLRTVAGGTPLSFLVQHWSMQLLDPSPFSGRLPSALASIAACAGLWLIARRSNLRWPIIAVAVFALYPLQFRYALEARPYALALCLSVWATVLITMPWSRWRAVAYAALVIASGATLAYALFVPAAHFLWLGYTRSDWRKLVLIISVAALTSAALLPWYLYFREDWTRELANEKIADPSWRWMLVFAREITGAGYLGTLLLGAGAWVGIRTTGSRQLWVWWALVPILLVPAANLVFGYFFAVRHMLYVVAPLALLFAMGVEAIGRRGHVLLALLLCVFLYADVRWFLRPREDWQAAAANASNALSQGGCVVFTPLDADIFFSYMDPSLHDRQCPLGPPADGGQVVVAVSPYDAFGAYEAVREALAGQGYTQQSRADFDGPRVETYRRVSPQ